MENWHHLAFKGQGVFAGQLVGLATNNNDLSPPLAGCLWELRRFYYHILTRDLHKWLSGKGRIANEAAGRDSTGEAMVQRIARLLLPGVPAVWVPSSKSQAGSKAPNSTSTTRALRFQEHMVSSGWLLAFVLSFATKNVSAKQKARALSLLEDIVATACGQDDIGTVPHLLSLGGTGLCVCGVTMFPQCTLRLWRYQVVPLGVTCSGAHAQLVLGHSPA